MGLIAVGPVAAVGLAVAEEVVGLAVAVAAGEAATAGEGGEAHAPPKEAEEGGVKVIAAVLRVVGLITTRTRNKAAAALREGRVDVVATGRKTPDAKVSAEGVLVGAKAPRLGAEDDKDRTRLAGRTGPNAVGPSKASPRAAPRREAPPEAKA